MSRVNEFHLRLIPRILPLHDSQQILGIRLNAWQREISYVREWYQKEHRNWVSLDGQRSKWWVWNQALDEARKSVRQIQTYLQRLSEGIFNHPNAFRLSKSPLYFSWLVNMPLYRLNRSRDPCATSCIEACFAHFYELVACLKCFLIFEKLKQLFSRKYQAVVVKTLDSALHWINHYPVDKY